MSCGTQCLDVDTIALVRKEFNRRGCYSQQLAILLEAFEDVADQRARVEHAEAEEAGEDVRTWCECSDCLAWRKQNGG